MPGPQPGPLRQTLLTEARALMDPGLSTGKTVTKKTVQDKYEKGMLVQEVCAHVQGLKERDSRHQEEMRQRRQEIHG